MVSAGHFVGAYGRKIFILATAGHWLVPTGERYLYWLKPGIGWCLRTEDIYIGHGRALVGAYGWKIFILATAGRLVLTDE